MKIMLIDTAYGFVLEGLNNRLGLENRLQSTFSEMGNQYSDLLFPTSDYWKIPLENLGHDVMSITANDNVRQTKWLLEFGREDILKNFSHQYLFNGITINNNVNPKDLMEEILIAQIEFFKPDFILCGIIETFGTEFIRKAKKNAKFKIIGQHQAPIPKIDVSGYDLILSSLPNLIEFYTSQGIHSEYLMLAADSRILKIKGELAGDKTTFFGSLSNDHLSRCRFFKDLGKLNTMDIWANPPTDWTYSQEDKITFHTPKFGYEMYSLMKSSSVTLNFHIDISGKYANNLRLFEAPACGTVLLTDLKTNLNEIYEIGEEILCYGSVEECSKIINFLKADSDARSAIAKKGRDRVARDHTFEARSPKLIDFFESI